MTTPQHQTKAAAFHSLHKPGDPLVLTNAWDAGSAAAVVKAGAMAVATGSASVAMAHGYDDGEKLPFGTLLSVLTDITQATDLPVSADFETGFAENHDQLRANVEKVVKTGIVGINFEDQMIETGEMRTLEDQVQRLQVIRAESNRLGLDLYINARTDLFLLETDQDRHAALVPEAKERLLAYRAAGAHGAFVPGLMRDDLIGDVCAAIDMPVNVLVMGEAVRRSHYASLGVARISAGPAPYRRAMAALEAETRRALSS
ncbi:MAG: isocitrate lyase/phosphoenolpyruvate mutase family protein [Pseudomonadota bacterium]